MLNINLDLTFTKQLLKRLNFHLGMLIDQHDRDGDYKYYYNRLSLEEFINILPDHIKAEEDVFSYIFYAEYKDAQELFKEPFSLDYTSLKSIFNVRSSLENYMNDNFGEYAKKIYNVDNILGLNAFTNGYILIDYVYEHKFLVIEKNLLVDIIYAGCQKDTACNIIKKIVNDCFKDIIDNINNYIRYYINYGNNSGYIYKNITVEELGDIIFEKSEILIGKITGKDINNIDLLYSYIKPLIYQYKPFEIFRSEYDYKNELSKKIDEEAKMIVSGYDKKELEIFGVELDPYDYAASICSAQKECHDYLNADILDISELSFKDLDHILKLKIKYDEFIDKNVPKYAKRLFKNKKLIEPIFFEQYDSIFLNLYDSEHKYIRIRKDILLSIIKDNVVISKKQNL